MSAAYWDESDLKAIDSGGLVREDVMDRIWDISNVRLEFTELVGSDGEADQSYHEWPKDELPAPNTNNANVSGADASGNVAGGGERVGNHCQNSDAPLQVTHRAQATNTVGRENERAWQIARAQKIVRRDVEAMALLNQASVQDDGDTVAGRAGGFDAWLETNVGVGATGAVGGFNPTTKLVEAATNGTPRALSEADLSDQIENAFMKNGNPTALMSRPRIIKNLGRFLFGDQATIAKPTANVQGTGGGNAQTAQGYINVLVTDFGTTLEMIPNRLQPYASLNEATVFGIDPMNTEIAFLEGYRTYPLGKQGTADQDQVNVDWTLAVYLEEAHFALRDIDESSAVTA